MYAVGKLNVLVVVSLCLLAWPGAAAGVALCRPIPREAASGNHCSVYPSLQHSPADPQFHKSGYGRQGNAADTSSTEWRCCKDFCNIMHVVEVVQVNVVFFCLLQAMKVVGIKAHTENDRGQVLLDLYIRWMFVFQSQWPLNKLLGFEKTLSTLLLFWFLSYVGNVEINVEVKRYFCKAGVKGIQVCLTKHEYITWIHVYVDVLVYSCSFNLSLRPLLVCNHHFTDSISDSLSLAPRDDASDSRASDWRRAHSGCRHYVFHSEAGRLICSHLCLSFSLCSRRHHVSPFRPYWFLIHPDWFAAHSTFFTLISSQKLDINWTGLTNMLDIPGLKWVMLK